MRDADLKKDERDSAPFAPKSVVIEPWFDWEGDRRLSIPWEDTIIYELHVKGMTKLHPATAGGDSRHLCGPDASGRHRSS